MADKRPMIQILKDGVRRVVTGVTQTLGFDLVAKFGTEEASVDLPIDMEGDTVWATQQQIADLFGVDRSVVNKHIAKLFENKEIERSEATCAKFAQVRREGHRGGKSIYRIESPTGKVVHQVGLPDDEPVCHELVAHLDRRLGINSPFPKTPDPYD